MAVSRIPAVPTLLQVLCDSTGMGFAAVVRVTDGTWTACAVRDGINFGLQPGGQLDVRTTLCFESRAACKPIMINRASTDPVYRDHHTARQYRIESYFSVPIVLADGDYFGNLCAIDRLPAKAFDPKIIAMFEGFARMLALQHAQQQAREQEQSVLRDERAASDSREQFIAILGHDLRCPAQAILTTAELIEREARRCGGRRHASARQDKRAPHVAAHR